MMGIETIIALNNDAGQQAKFRGLTPKVLDQGFSFEDMRSIPNLGDYEPPGWEFIQSHFVDSSGFGRPGEPALTIEQFEAKIREIVAEHPGRGFGIVSTGQFQVHIGEFATVAELS